jgi:hypothetical protein
VKNLIILFIALTSLSCNDEMDFIDPLSESDNAIIKSYVLKMNNDSISNFYDKMSALSAQTINLSTENAIRQTPQYKVIYNYFENNLDNLPLLFDFIIYDKRCEGEVQSNARSLLWELAKNNYSITTEEIEKELLEQKTSVDGIKVLTPEVLRDYDIKLVKALVQHFEE